MEKTLRVLNLLEKEGLIERYAIGGAVASLFYTEPTLTYDVDVFVFLPKTAGRLVLLSPLYDYLKQRGYREEREHVMIEGVPVQLIPAYNALVEEAVREAKEVKYKSVKTRILRAEYLAAIMLQTGRPKDKERLTLLLEEGKVDRKRLGKIIRRFDLAKKWGEFKRRACEE